MVLAPSASSAGQTIPQAALPGGITAAVAESTTAPAADSSAVPPESSLAPAQGASADSLGPSPGASPLGDRRPPLGLSSAATLDTIGLNLRVGTRADVTNESYYEDAFVDTTFLGRRFVGTPEERYAGMFEMVVAGTRDRRETRYRLQAEASAGDQLQRGYASLYWRSALGTRWTASVDPNVEFRNDRTFDRNLRELKGRVGGRLRRGFDDDLTGFEVGLGGDVLRAAGEGTEFLPDRQTASANVALDHLGLLGDEWRVGYRLAGRTFPDSTDRDHLEHLWEGRWKSAGARGAWVSADMTGTRRVTLRLVPTSRDNYWVVTGGLEGRASLADDWAIGARAEGEATRYDVQDDNLYFDYQVGRGRLDLQYDPAPRWSASLGPRGEILVAPLSPGEGYQEIAGVFDLEFLGWPTWWNATPSAGWRDYDEIAAAGPGTPALHSSYAFYGLDLIADQPLLAGLRFKAMAALRWEYHVDPAQDARSVYASLELSRSLHR
jgi:hypothetical protein